MNFICLSMLTCGLLFMCYICNIINDQTQVTMKSAIFTSAWAIQRQNPTASFSWCLRKAWAAHKLRARMQKGAEKFEFIKADGTVRFAVGTLDETQIAYEAKGGRKSGPAVIAYFDLEVGEFRSFRIDRLVA